jgi:hypothetical protein
MRPALRRFANTRRTGTGFVNDASEIKGQATRPPLVYFYAMKVIQPSTYAFPVKLKVGLEWTNRA